MQNHDRILPETMKKDDQTWKYSVILAKVEKFLINPSTSTKQALGSGLVGSNRPLIVTSGTALVASGRLATEADMPDLSSSSLPRVASEEAALTVASQGVHLSVVRLPPTVHGDGDHGFVPILINLTRDKGFSAYVGEGLNCWPAVHRLDAAHLFRLALEKCSIGARYHGVAEECVAFRDIARTIGRHLNSPVISKS